ncbi:MAG: hypothetical protein ACK4M9_09940 [Anaerobacillus sp.]|uniref:hypothetical protein n=1 Tax=Anaerobacillus sp. TaxID=1872506 RepID=UPI00391B88E3
MQINNQAITNQMITHEKPLELKQGEIYRATIKERSTDNEAILQIRGREIQVKFEGKTPLQDRVTVQINGQNDQQVQVKAISDTPRTSTASAPQTEAANINQALRSLGISNPSQELRQAAQIVLDKGVPLNRESVQELRNFIEKENGTVEQRLNTVQAVANKRLEVTPNHLRSVHEALNGRPLNELLTNITKELETNSQIRSGQPEREREITRAEARVQVEQRTAQAEPRVVERQAMEPRVAESRPMPDRPVSEQVREVREQVQRESNVQRSIEQVRSEVVNNPRVDREVVRQVERSVDEARALQQTGREVAARERMVQALQTAERDVARTEARTQAEPRVVESRQAMEPRVAESRPMPERSVSDQVRDVREQVQREPNVQRSVEQVRNEVVNNPRVDREVVRQVERSVDEARALQQTGREVAARERMVQALQTAERDVARTEARTQAEPRVVESRQVMEPRVAESRPMPDRPVGEQVREVREQVQREPNVQRSIEQVRSEVVNNPRVDPEVARQVERALDGARMLQQTGRESAARDRVVQVLQTVERTLNNQQLSPANQAQQEEQLKPSEQLKQMQATVQKEGDFQKAVNLLNNQIEKAPFDMPIKEQLQKAINDATKLQEEGRELAARQQLMQAFTAIERPVAKLDQAVQPEMQQYLMNEAFQTQQLSSKDFIVQTVTEKLAKAQGEFKTLQREITRNLDNIQRLTEAFKSQAANQVKPLLETTIKKLDHAILKSEMMLLTDMKTEKSLMQASSQLAEAKKLLTKGNYQEANKIVQDVKTMIEKLEFKPSENKVKHFIMKEEQNLTNRTGSQQLLQQFDEMTRRSAMQEPSARQAFELVRGLGLNRDSEVAQMLASGKQANEEPNQNMKQALMQLMKMEEEQGRVSQQTSQALANITGQQLLSKSDNSNLQSMFLSIPFILQDEVKNLQVFVNSRNEGQQVDWENCNLYFLIETKKLGEVGILVTSTDRNLSLTIKNDQPFFKERIEPLAEVCKGKLKEVGYNIASLNFTKLNATQKPKVENNQVQGQPERMTPTFTEKGFDFKV